MTEPMRSEDLPPPPPRLSIHPGEPLDGALRRMALEQAQTMEAPFHAEAGDELLDHKVHSARKAGKRLRSLFRLTRDHLGDATYHQSNLLVRDQGRRLSELRSATVVLQTLDELAAEHAMDPTEIAPFRSALESNRESLVRRLESDGNGAEEARRALDALARGITEFPTPEAYAAHGVAALRLSLKATYRRARRSMQAAVQDGSAHSFHEWRKQVNHFRYQLEALGGACGAEVTAISEALNALSEQLGAANDMEDLLDACKREESVVPRSLPPVIAERQRHHMRSALAAGQELFAPKPKTFARSFIEDCNAPPEA